MPAGGDIAAVQLAAPAAAAAMRAAARAASTHRHTVLDPPHVSLGYPWPADVDLAAIAAVAATTAPLAVTVGGVATWGDRTVVVHLPVEPAAPVRALADRLGWPEPASLRPHVSLVRLYDADERVVDAVVDAAHAEAPPALQLDHLEVSVRRTGTWRDVGRFALAG